MDTIKIILFIFNKKIIIVTDKKELMINIIKKFEKALSKDLSSAIFYYKGNIINVNQKLKIEDIYKDKINEDMKIFAFLLKKTEEIDSKKIIDKCNEENEEKKLNDEYIICPKCMNEYSIKNRCLINFDDYKITFSECNKGHIINDILLDEFDHTQRNNNENNTPKGDTLSETCNNNIDGNKCNLHKNEIFCSYCTKCKKNLCFICENNHEHKESILLYNNILNNSEEYINNLNKELNEFREKLDIFVDEVNEIKNILNVVKNNFETYYYINKNIIDNYDIYKRNYWMLKNLKEIDFSDKSKEIDKIIKNDNINNKFN